MHSIAETKTVSHEIFSNRVYQVPLTEPCSFCVSARRSDRRFSVLLGGPREDVCAVA